MKKTKEIKVGNIIIGGGNKIIIQSMTNTKTKNILDTVKQINNLEKSGCELVRVAVLDETDAYALKEIKKQINIPLVADIHFDYKLALIAIDMGIDKLRINPGNIGSIDKIKMVVEKCKEKNIPIRIGVNSGSLEKEIKETYGSSAVALVKSAERHVKILEDLNFKEIIISLKASNVKTTVEAYRLASKTFSYPLHLGVTEAGTITIGTIKSSVALGILLNEGIGDTIRVSLSSEPIDEIRVAKEILASLNLYQKPDLISCPTCGRTQYNMIPIVNEIEKFLDTLGNVSIKVAIMGCAVNGPGEAMDADLGIAGGVNSALLFKKGVIIKKIPQEDIIEELKKEILLMIK